MEAAEAPEAPPQAAEDGGAGAGGGEDAPLVHVLELADVSGDGARIACPSPGCDRVFKSRPNLTVHMRSHPGLGPHAPVPSGPPPRRGRFHCMRTDCAFGPGGRTLASLKTAQQHWTMCHGDRKHACTAPGCGAMFAKAHQLNRHTRNAHASAACVCGVTFGSSHALKKHVTHFGATAAPGTHAAVVPVAEPAAGGAAAEGGGEDSGEEEAEEADAGATL